ncbi:hypothetical protein BDQ17DRAFT_1425659 [Cyathus striatus]|nr:hypothetical protein BDQ17DRAFT_1425659 [Cyathus striatus]
MNRTKLVKQARMKPKVSTRTNSDLAPSSSSLSKALSDVRIVSFEYANKTMIDTSPNERHCTANTVSLPTTPDLPSNALICTRIPQSQNDTFGASECILYSHTKQNIIKTPSCGRLPPSPDRSWAAYEIRSKGSVAGQGMFAKRALKVGDLILVERPLMMVSLPIDLSEVSKLPDELRDVIKQGDKTPNSIMDATVKVAFSRLTPRNQKAFLALSNAHSGSTFKYSAIWTSNSFELFAPGILGDGEKNDIYSMLFKDISRINHRPNCVFSFDVASFSFQARASKPIAIGEEIFYAYTDPLQFSTAAKRQGNLKDYGFTCTCTACSPSISTATSNSTTESESNSSLSESDLRRTLIRDTFIHYESTINFRNIDQFKNIVYVRGVNSVYRQLMDDMEKEGLSGINAYRTVLDVYTMTSLVLAKSGSDEEKMKFRRAAQSMKATASRYALAHDGCFETSIWDGY